MSLSKTKVKIPIAVRWKIAKSRLDGLKDSDEYLESIYCDDDDVGGFYCLALFPNGSEEETRGQSWVYFRFESFWEVIDTEVEYTVSIETANFSKTCAAVSGEREGWGFKLCTTDELFNPASQFIVNGEMEIKLDGFLLVEKDVVVEPCRLASDSDVFCLVLWNQDNKDFTFVAEGKEIMAHKLILSARSPVFGAMFQPHTKEAEENKVVIPDFAFHIVETAVKLCYHSCLAGHISFEDRISLLQFFDKYDMTSLKYKLEDYMINEVDENTVCRLSNASIASNSFRLRNRCTEFLHDCLRNTKPIGELDILDKDFSLDVFKKAFYYVSK